MAEVRTNLSPVTVGTAGDRLSASWILVVGTVLLAWLYWRTKGKVVKEAGTALSAPLTRFGDNGSILDGIRAFAAEMGFSVHPNPTGGGHVPGSLHYAGRAADLGVAGKSAADIERLKREAASRGYRVIDERMRPPGEWQWTGPHLHIEKPYGQETENPADIEGQLP